MLLRKPSCARMHRVQIIHVVSILHILQQIVAISSHPTTSDTAASKCNVFCRLAIW